MPRKKKAAKRAPQPKPQAPAKTGLSTGVIPRKEYAKMHEQES